MVSSLEPAFSSERGLAIVLFQKVIGLEFSKFFLEGRLLVLGMHGAASRGILVVGSFPLVFQFLKDFADFRSDLHER